MKKTTSISLMTVIRYMAGHIWQTKRLFLFAVVCSLVGMIASRLIPLYIKDVVDLMTGFVGGDKTNIVASALSVFGIIVGLMATQWTGRKLFDLGFIPTELRGMQRIYMECFRYLHKHSQDFFANSFAGALVKKVNKLVGSFESVTDMFIFNILSLCVSLTIGLRVMFEANVWLGGGFVTRSVIYIIIQIVLHKWKLPYDYEANEHDSLVTGVLADTIANNTTIRSFASGDRENIYFGQTTKTWAQKQGASWYRGSFVVRGISDIVSLGFNALLLYLCITLRGKNILSIGTVVMIQMVFMRVSQELRDVGNIFKRLYRSLSESAEMLEILQKPHDIQDKKPLTALHVSAGNIRFDHVNFAYANGVPVFHDFNLTIPVGQKVALVGQSGAGKTTIIKLLTRLYDIQGGSITIDKQNIADVMQDSLRGHISLVPQDPILFHRTLRENISYGKPDATDDEIIAAAKKAHCHEFISKLPDGYETMVGERGIKLSGGERQRVAIARAMLENKKILILDEATSSLDSESEQFIQDAITKVMEGKTAIVIAHRLSTIMKMDRIVVLGPGGILEDGDHKTLLRLPDGHYKKLRDIQSGGFLPE